MGDAEDGLGAAVAGAEALEELNLRFPALDKAALRDLAIAKATLEGE